MAEALAVVGIVLSIVGLVDFDSKALHRLNEFQSSRGEIPESFKHKRKLLETLNQTKLAIEKRGIKEETREALSSVVDGCQTQITLLDDLIGKSLPQDQKKDQQGNFKPPSRFQSHQNHNHHLIAYSGLDKLPLHFVSIADFKRCDCLVADLIIRYTICTTNTIIHNALSA